MKKYFIALSLIFAVVYCQHVSAKEALKIVKKGEYSLSLKSKTVTAHKGITEVIDIDSLETKIPDHFFATVQMGDWIGQVPGEAILSDADHNVINPVEYWDISFAKVRHGRILFIRNILNNTDTDLESNAWDITIKVWFVKFP